MKKRDRLFLFDVNVLFVPCLALPCSALPCCVLFCDDDRMEMLAVDALAVPASAITNPINVVHFCLECESFRVSFTEVKSRNRTSTFMVAK